MATPVLLRLGSRKPLDSFTPVQAVMVTKAQNMPAMPVKKSFLRPKKSMVVAQRTAQQKLLMVIHPLIISCVLLFVMPIDSRRSTRKYDTIALPHLK